MMPLVVWVSAASGACGDEGALATALADADAALAVLDGAGFGAAVDRARTEVGCAHALLPPTLAAALHRAVGIQAFGDGDSGAAAAAFAAARRIEPDRTLPVSLFPEESSVSAAFSSFDLKTLHLEPLPAPADGWIALDGTRTLDRAPALPVVFQRVAPDGTVAGSAYLLPGEAPLAYPTPSPVPVAVTRSAPKRRAPLAVATAATGVTALSLYGIAAVGHGRYVGLDSPVPDDRLTALRTRTNALVVASVGGAGLCALSGALLVATW